MLDYFRKLFTNTTKSDRIIDELNELGSKPEELLTKLKPQLEATATTCVSMKTEEDKTLTLEQSKFGGWPYFPKDQDLPQDKSGKPMRLLAQLNFADIPNLPPYPEKGLLQFFISEEDDLYGLDFDHPTNQQGFRVLFFEDLNFEPRRDLQDIYKKKWEYSPLQIEPLALTFETKKDYPTYPSIEYFQQVRPLFENLDKGEHIDVLEDLYLGGDTNAGHKIGGTPYFTQNEVREDKEAFKDYILLFQMDSDGNKILWGDVGIANFFIDKEDLEKRNFSKVLYNWDCH